MSDTAPVRTLQPLVIGAFDLSGFLRATRGFDDHRLADVVDHVYLAIGAAVASSGGRVVKFLGDGALAVWPPDRADAAVEATLRLRDELAASLLALGVRSDLVARIHHGEVMAGEFGPDRGYDVIGTDVFTVFRLPARTLAVSAEAFRRLGPDTRARLHKHTEPVVYIPAGDPRP
jgi:class 3 adenylate cyclase